MTKKNIAVLGCGYWGKNHVRVFNKLGVLAAVCDPSPEGRRTAQELAPNAQIFSDPQEIWDHRAIDGVVIATPAGTHAELCRAAMLAGKDVLCEKPLALQYEEAQALVKISDDTKRILMVGHILEYHPAIQKVRALIAENQLGKVRYIYSNRLNLGKIRREENILWSFAPHDIAIILRLVNAMPYQVLAAGGTYITPNIADVTITQLLFDNGISAHVFVSWLNPFKEQKLVVVGSERMATYDDINKELVLHDQRVEVNPEGPVPVRGEGTKLPVPEGEPLSLEADAFIQAIATRKQPLTDGRSALRVLRVLQAAQRSLVTQGYPVQLPME